MTDPTVGDTADPNYRPDSPATSGAGPEKGTAPPPPPVRPAFPWVRLFYAIGFSALAWVVFWGIVLILAPLHYITLAITGSTNEELRQMNLRATHYLFQLLAFISGAHDEKPFPLGHFPKD